MTREDLALLRRIRGRFSESGRCKWSQTFYAGLFGFGMPLLFGFALLHDGIPPWPLNGDQATLAVLIPASAFLGWFLGHSLYDEYEFTGVSIILWRRSRKHRTISLDEIVKAEVRTDRYGNSTMVLESSGGTFPILIYPSLRTLLIKGAAEPWATGS
jgi:hypothetical protein